MAREPILATIQVMLQLKNRTEAGLILLVLIAVLKFLKEETYAVLNMRLEVLSSNKCEDLALRLARICVRCMKLPGSSLLVDCSPEQRNNFIDFYVALLYKHKLFTEIRDEVSWQQVCSLSLSLSLYFF
jgi:hypothetical protein